MTLLSPESVKCEYVHFVIFVMKSMIRKKIYINSDINLSKLIKIIYIVL